MMKERNMKVRHWLTLGGMTLAALGAGLLVETFLPQRLRTEIAVEQEGEALSGMSLPNVEVTFLRCGSNTLPACLAVRGMFSLAPRSLAYSPVLVRHPTGTVLYDTVLSADIQR